MVKVQYNETNRQFTVTIPQTIARAMKLRKGDEVDWVWSDYERSWMLVKRR